MCPVICILRSRGFYPRTDQTDQIKYRQTEENVEHGSAAQIWVWSCKHQPVLVQFYTLKEQNCII